MIHSPELFEFTEDAVLSSICRESFHEFFLTFWPYLSGEKLVENWHIKFLCDELQLVAEQVFLDKPKLYDLVINISPGSTKTSIVSIALPAWMWTRMPHFWSLNTSHTDHLALDHAVKCRDLMRSDLYQRLFPEIQMKADQDRKGLFANTLGGRRLSVGVAGKVTGFHGHLITIDDPLDPEESYSEAELKRVTRWMQQTLPMRGIWKTDTPWILVMQRLHQADPSGDMLANNNGRLRHLCIPGELNDEFPIEPPELRRFYRDGLFDPVRIPRHVLNDSKRRLGAYGYAAQIGQTPIPLGGGSFKIQNLAIVNGNAPRMVRMVRSWDKAGTPNGGNYSAGVLLGWDANDQPWILDVERGQWGARDREDVILNKCKLDNAGAFAKFRDGHGSVLTITEIEGGSGGKESAESTIRNLAGYHVTAYHPTGDKVSRAYNFASAMGIKDHVHVLNREWTQDWIDEHKYFPYGKFDDQVDATASGYTRIARKGVVAGGIRSLLMTGR